jgi:hypothetical protein
LVLAGFGVTLFVVVVLLTHVDFAARPGDTDDAMRLVMVRDLLSGRGWYDQLIPRLQPPQGLYMHWSRLIDGGIASIVSVYRVFASQKIAEFLGRVTWPLLWIAPAVMAALFIARAIGAKTAVLVAAVLLLNMEIYRQFLPGRIDHHNVQIVGALVSLAFAMAPSGRPRFAACSGLASAAGLAVGLEALPFHVLIGASFAAGFILDERRAQSAGAYGLALAVGAAALFVAQTPPWRWSLAACDAMGLNLVCALAVGGLGLGLASLRPAKSRALRCAVMVLCALAAAFVYLGLDPACIHGPFAGIDPQAQTQWLDKVQEVQPLNVIWRLDRESAVSGGAFLATSLLAAVWLAAARRWRPTLNLGLALVAMVLAAVMGALVWRMMDYVFWIGLAVLAAAISQGLRRWRSDLLLPTLAATVALSPATLTAAVNESLRFVAPNHQGLWSRALDQCSQTGAFAQLAGLPRGVVLADPDLGPYILRATPQSVVAAPYHRMSRSVMAAIGAFDDPPDKAEGVVRSLRATYVVDCPALPFGSKPGALGALLRQDRPPTWLERVSPAGARLEIYRVRSR